MDADSPQERPGYPPLERTWRNYAEWRPTATTGLLWLQHGTGTLARAIQEATQSYFNHIAMLVWRTAAHDSRDDVLLLAESYGPKSQITSARTRAEQLLSERSTEICIYAIRPEIASYINFDGAASWMLHFSGQDYPEDHITRNLLAIVTGRVINPIPNDDRPWLPRTCSESIHAAARCHGLTPINDYDYMVFPSRGEGVFGAGWTDVAEYQCSLRFSQDSQGGEA